MIDGTYLTGLFADRDGAERAYRDALDRGYKRDEVQVVMSDETRACQFAPDEDGRTTGLGRRVAEGAGIDGEGGWIGTLVGWNIPHERIRHYERGVAQGGILMGVRLRNEDDATHLERQWRDADAVDVYR